MAYIANKPVRFDRTYAIGEVVPDAVIDPKMTRRLIEMGRIICVDLPASDGKTETPPVSGPEDADSSLGDGEFVCLKCGKAFGSQNALSAHSRSHKE